MANERHINQRAQSRKRKKQNNEPSCSDDNRFHSLEDYNLELAIEGLTAEQLIQLLAINPEKLILRTAAKAVEILENEFLDSETLIDMPGISVHRLKELRMLGLVPFKSANRYFYRGKHVIAYYMGNLKALMALEQMNRPVAAR